MKYLIALAAWSIAISAQSQSACFLLATKTDDTLSFVDVPTLKEVAKTTG